METILPCARCGGAAGLEAFELNRFVRWRVRCARCQAVGIHYHRAPVAIGLWNEASAAAAWADAAGQVAEASGQISTLAPEASGREPDRNPTVDRQVAAENAAMIRIMLGADASGPELIAILAGQVEPGETPTEALCRIIRERDAAARPPADGRML